MGLSSPKGSSVNDGISADLCSLFYISVDDISRVVASLGRGTLLAKVVHSLCKGGLAQSTQRTYAARKEIHRLLSKNNGSTPASNRETAVLLCGIPKGRIEGLRHQTVKSYLAAVRHMQISSEMGDPKLNPCHAWS